MGSQGREVRDKDGDGAAQGERVVHALQERVVVATVDRSEREAAQDVPLRGRGASWEAPATASVADCLVDWLGVCEAHQTILGGWLRRPREGRTCETDRVLP